MKVLSGEQWTDGFLDYARAPGELRIRVQGWRVLERLDDMYFVRPKSLRLVWNYLREVGPVAVARKVVSRGSEGLRNDKFVSCGWGTVLEADAGSPYAPGDRVCFVATAHPRCVDRITVPHLLAAPFAEPPVTAPDSEVLYLEGTGGADVWWAGLRGWSPFAGRVLDPAEAGAAMDAAAATLRACDWSTARRLPAAADEPRTRRSAARGSASSAAKPTAVLFGYGNYAKTLVLPNVAPFVQVRRIQEVDPTQVPRSDREYEWDSSPVPPGDEATAEVYLIAGFHHTHAPLSVHALRAGAYAVAEKPVAVDHDQLDTLLDAVEAGGERFFACFHKRYLPFNDVALRDLGVRRGAPVHYHCVVYEVPLPELHWYRWPNSHSRLVSNGCHWVDHALFLNGWPEVARSEVFEGADGTVNVSMEMDNGAVFTMVLTEHGSERIGVQDHVELRANGVTVTMVNGSAYRAEGPDRVLRRLRINKMRSYTEMYRTIGRAVMEGRTGDSLRSIRVSAAAVLELESLLLARRAAEREPGGVLAGSTHTNGS